jgi:quercetin dioxygenase-like cupin family protein
MKMIHGTIPLAALSAAILLMLTPLPLKGQVAPEVRTPRVIRLDPAAQGRSQHFDGPPGTYTMRSGYMVLAPTQSVGRHSTRTNEEAVIVLAGSGEMRISNGPVLQLRPYSVLYVPPETEHDVFNTGADTLRYVWVVARAIP